MLTPAPFLNGSRRFRRLSVLEAETKRAAEAYESYTIRGTFAAPSLKRDIEVVARARFEKYPQHFAAALSRLRPAAADRLAAFPQIGSSCPPLRRQCRATLEPRDATWMHMGQPRATGCAVPG
jgi:hypothetical protein